MQVQHLRMDGLNYWQGETLMDWAYPSTERVEIVANNLRPQDELEVWLSDGISGYDAVMESFYESTVSRVIMSDHNTPVGVTGVCGDRIWLLGTTELANTKSHRWQLAVHGRQWVKHCIDVVGGPIGNHVYAENRLAIRWLKHLGFVVEKAQPFGVNEASFCEFWRSA